MACSWNDYWNPMLEAQVTQDQHWTAMEWLEAHLEAKIFMFDIDDLQGMVEQVCVTQVLHQASPGIGIEPHKD